MVHTDVAMEVTTDAVQLFGGYGYTADFPVGRYLRDAKITQIYEAGEGRSNGWSRNGTLEVAQRHSFRQTILGAAMTDGELDGRVAIITGAGA